MVSTARTNTETELCREELELADPLKGRVTDTTQSPNPGATATISRVLSAS